MLEFLKMPELFIAPDKPAQAVLAVRSTGIRRKTKCRSEPARDGGVSVSINVG
jgi:hypothetical protein